MNRSSPSPSSGSSSYDFDQKARATADQIADATADYANKAIETTQAALNTVADQARDSGERVQQVAGNMKTAVDKSLKTQPMTTLAIAAAAGFVMGALWKS